MMPGCRQRRGGAGAGVGGVGAFEWDEMESAARLVLGVPADNSAIRACYDQCRRPAKAKGKQQASTAATKLLLPPGTRHIASQQLCLCANTEISAFRALTVGDGDLSFSLALKQVYPASQHLCLCTNMADTGTAQIAAFRALTVGDGDLSFSLALKRAYPQVDVTASTLVESSAELFRTYASAVETSREFEGSWKGRIIYGVDATKLEERIEAESEEDKFDVVLFNHPHLGDATLLESEQRHAERHYGLLAHYFFSAKKLLKRDGRIHVCLCGNQPKSWRVRTAAEINGLRCTEEQSTAVPIGQWLFELGQDLQLAKVEPHYPSKRKFRNGALGSKHFLARYGYVHRRTEGDLFDRSVKHINVQQSINFAFACKIEFEVKSSKRGEKACNICKLEFESSELLRSHLAAPALPDVANQTSDKEDVDENNAMGEGSNSGEKQSSAPLPLQPIDIQDATILIEAAVTARFDSKRIKWLCRQNDFPLSKFIKSKSQCEGAIKKGRVFVNQEVALDSGRIVRENDVVTLVEEYEPVNDAQTKDEIGRIEDSEVRFVKELTSLNSQVALEVVYKPVGIRCAGSFSPNTLEMITKTNVEHKRGTSGTFCHAISKLDTGCAGLCLVAISPTKITETELKSLTVLYTFTALVHGRFPDKMCTVKAPTTGLRQWKRQRTDQNENKYNAEDGEPIFVATSNTDLNLENALLIKCEDTLQVAEQHMSTLSVQSRFDSGRLANVISFVLRKLGYPVVNDRFAKREYSALPRRLRNIAKHKVCIGCYRIDVDYEGSSTT
ncbi:hypothetical protein ACHAWF_003890, partial [Thalassiosira exigua]